MDRISIPADQRATDAILRTIFAFEQGTIEFSKTPAEEELQHVHLWEQPLDELKTWSRPIESRRGASVALRLLLSSRHCLLDGSPVANALLTAVADFIESLPPQPVEMEREASFISREMSPAMLDLDGIFAAIDSVATAIVAVDRENAEAAHALEFLAKIGRERVLWLRECHADLQALGDVQPAANREAANV